MSSCLGLRAKEAIEATVIYCGAYGAERALSLVFHLFFSSPNYRFVDVDKLEFDVGGSRFVIRRLRKYTKYEIVVQAVNTFGEGPLSIPSIGQTQEDGK